MLEHYETKISKKNLDIITNGNMTPSELIDFLESGALYRSFKDVLLANCSADNLAGILRARLPGIEGNTPTKKEIDTIRRNITNWLNGTTIPQSREQLFKICFALELNETQTSRVLASASETGIHYRNPKELVYAFALRFGLSYADALILNHKMEHIYQPIVDAAEIERQAMWKKKEKIYHEKRLEARRHRLKYDKQELWSEQYLRVLEDDTPHFLTQQVTHRFEKVTDQSELRQFFIEASADLGTIHESAYEKFWQLLLILQEPNDEITQVVSSYEVTEIEDYDNNSEVYALDRIAQTYFRMNVPIGKKTGNYSYLQKAIKKNWPGATELKKMKSRKIDVSRKALLLLFLITEDFLFSEDLQHSDRSDEDAAWFLLEEDESPRDQLEIVLSKVNLFLETYGMNQLDPGNPFDCLVLYSLAAEYGTEFLSDKFSSALEELFSRVTETT